MKTLQLELPDQMARELQDVVETGVFENAEAVIRVAVREFIAHRRFELVEQQHLRTSPSAAAAEFAGLPWTGKALSDPAVSARRGGVPIGFQRLIL